MEDVRAVLGADRARVAARLAGLERDFAAFVEAAQSANADDEHDPEGATLAFERQHLAALIDQSKDRIRDIDAALVRVEAGTYGLCVRCGRPIPAQRLAARPAAATCMACASRA